METTLFDESEGPGSGSTDLWDATSLVALMDFPGVGAARAIKVAETFKSWDALVDASQDARKAVARVEVDVVGKPRFAEAREGMRLIGWFDQDYPRALRRIKNPPAVLWVRGAIPDPPRRLAIVGSRATTEWGRSTASYVATGAAASHICVVSGLALGIDIAAHRAALDAGGATIAVLGSGVDVPSPKEHLADAERILDEGGALVSEQPPGMPPSPRSLVARNRIQSGRHRLPHRPPHPQRRAHHRVTADGRPLQQDRHHRRPNQRRRLMPPRPNIVLALSESARATMISAARRAHPNETGGILIGVDLDDGHPWVTAAIEIASDDRGRRHYRIPGGSTQPAVRAARLAYQRLGYLGDWHTHPGNSGPSPTDLATLARHSLTHLVDLMATDITNRLVDAGRLRAAWSPDRARSLASSVARAIPDAWVDWDEESGEEWARVLVDQFVVALIRVKIPLVIVVRGELTPVRQIEHDAVMIVVDDMDSPLLSATSESIGHAFQEREVSPTLDPTVFSAMDLWFATT